MHIYTLAEYLHGSQFIYTSADHDIAVWHGGYTVSIIRILDEGEFSVIHQISLSEASRTDAECKIRAYFKE